MDVLSTFTALLRYYLTSFYPFFFLHVLLMLWFVRVWRRGRGWFLVEMQVLRKLEDANDAVKENVLAEYKNSHVAKMLSRVLEVARTLSTVDINGNVTALTEPLRQTVATGTTIANLFLISGVLGTLAGMYQGAAEVSGGNASIGNALRGAFNAFGVTVVAIFCAAVVLLLTSRLRQRIGLIQEKATEQAETYLQLHGSELGGELARRLNSTLDGIKEVFDKQWEQIRRAEENLGDAIKSFSTLLKEYGGFKEVTDKMLESLKQLQDNLGQVQTFIDTTLGAQREALEEGYRALNKMWEEGRKAQEKVLEDFRESVHRSLDGVRKAVGEATAKMNELVTYATDKSTGIVAAAKEEAEGLIQQTAGLYKAEFEAVKRELEGLSGNFEKVAKEAARCFKSELTTMKGSVEDIIGEVKKWGTDWAKSWDSFTQTMKGQFQQMVKEFQDSAAKISQNVGSLSETYEQAVEKLVKTREDWDKALGSFASTLAEHTEKAVKQGLEPLTSTLDQSLRPIPDTLKKLTLATERLEGTLDRASIVLERLEAAAQITTRVGAPSGAPQVPARLSTAPLQIRPSEQTVVAPPGPKDRATSSFEGPSRSLQATPNVQGSPPVDPRAVLTRPATLETASSPGKVVGTAQRSSSQPPSTQGLPRYPRLEGMTGGPPQDDRMAVQQQDLTHGISPQSPGTASSRQLGLRQERDNLPESQKGETSPKPRVDVEQTTADKNLSEELPMTTREGLPKEATSKDHAASGQGEGARGSESEAQEKKWYQSLFRRK